MNKTEFTQITSNWDSHRPLLWEALEATKHLKLPVLELGCGEGSTPFLRKYCADEGLKLYSYDYKKEWAEKYRAVHHNWINFFWGNKYGVALIDESPGEHRKVSLQNVKAEVIVIHDSEPLGWNMSDYQVRPLFSKFKYVLDYEQPKPLEWTTALSNSIDVTKFEL